MTRVLTMALGLGSLRGFDWRGTAHSRQALYFVYRVVKAALWDSPGEGGVSHPQRSGIYILRKDDEDSARVTRARLS